MQPVFRNSTEKAIWHVVYYLAIPFILILYGIYVLTAIIVYIMATPAWWWNGELEMKYSILKMRIGDGIKYKLQKRVRRYENSP